MPETVQYIRLPDGTYAALVRSMSWADAVIILLLVGMFFLQVYGVWSQSQRGTRESQSGNGRDATAALLPSGPDL